MRKKYFNKNKIYAFIGRAVVYTAYFINSTNNICIFRI